VEDEELMLRLLASTLTRHHYEVLPAATGREALDRRREQIRI
jgi:DNA-binding response OmpR family regulator